MNSFQLSTLRSERDKLKNQLREMESRFYETENERDKLKNQLREMGKLVEDLRNKNERIHDMTDQFLQNIQHERY